MYRVRLHNYASKTIVCFQKFMTNWGSIHVHVHVQGLKVYNRDSAVVEHTCKLTMCSMWLCLKQQWLDRLCTRVIVHSDLFILFLLILFYFVIVYFWLLWLWLAHIQVVQHFGQALLNGWNIVQLVCVAIITTKKHKLQNKTKNKNNINKLMCTITRLH